MAAAPKLSIITPVLNGERFVIRLIDSLKQQSIEDWEHIVVDGGSTDATLDIVRSAYKSDSRLVLYEEPGLGLYASVLKGMSVARSDIFAWQNADDCYSPWAFKAVLDYQHRTGAKWITGLPGCWDESGVMRFVRPYGWYPVGLIKRGWFHSELLGFLQQESMIITKQAFAGLSEKDRSDISGSSLAGDYLMWRALARSSKLEVLPTVLAGFRRHPGNKSTIEFERYMDEVRNSGAPFYPRIFATIFRRLFRCCAAFAALQSVEDEDRHLQQEIENRRSSFGAAGNAQTPETSRH